MFPRACWVLFLDKWGPGIRWELSGMMKTHIVLRPSPLVSLKIDTGVLSRVTGAVGVPSGQSYLNWEKKTVFKNFSVLLLLGRKG